MQGPCPAQPVEKIPFVSYVCQGKCLRAARALAFSKGLFLVPYRQKKQIIHLSMPVRGEMKIKKYRACKRSKKGGKGFWEFKL
jgi:hypothetical protein